jgi:hypothetical protein
MTEKYVSFHEPFDVLFDAPIEARVIVGDEQATVCVFPYGSTDGEIATAKSTARRIADALNKIVSAELVNWIPDSVRCLDCGEMVTIGQPCSSCGLGSL